MSKSGSGFRLPPGSSISIEQALKNKAASQSAAASSSEKAMTKPSKFTGAIADAMATQPSNVTPLVNRDLDEVHDGFMVLPVDEIDLFDNNVRLQENPERESIKASIRQNGFRGTIEVTRRPGTKRWIVSAGGNTRLDVVKELFAESGDTRFSEIKVTTMPYRGEVMLLVNHIAENDNRGDTTFWERASGYARLKAMLEEERGKSLTVRDFEEAAKQNGISVSKSILAYSRFAVDKLAKLSATLLLKLSLRDVQDTLQPAYNQLRALAVRLKRADEDALRFAIDNETEAYSLSLEFRSQDPVFNSQALAQRWIDAGAKLLGSHRVAVQAAIQFMEQPDLDVTDVELEQVLSRPVNADKASRPPVSRGSPLLPNLDAQEDAAAFDAVKIEPEVGLEKRLQLVQASALVVADSFGLTDCLRLQKNLPAGFFVEMPTEPLNSNLIGDIDPRYYGWYLLSYISGQRTFQFVDRLENESAWKSMMLNDTLFEAQDEILGPFVGGEIAFRTMLFGDLPGPRALIALISQVRALRDLAPDRFIGFAENRID
jgi:ParB family protein of integrating conjugative element (PFGI_1 class)